MARLIARRFVIAFVIMFTLTWLLGLRAGAQGLTGADDPVIADGNVATSLQLWELIGAFLLPLATSVIMQSRWSQRVQALVAFAVSLVYVLVQCWLRGELDNWVDPTTSLLTVLALTIAFYKGFWKPTGVAPAIEHSVLPGKPST